MQIIYISRSDRLTSRVYETIAKLAATAGDDSSLARAFVSTGGRLAFSMSMALARIRATAAASVTKLLAMDRREIRKSSEVSGAVFLVKTHS